MNINTLGLIPIHMATSNHQEKEKNCRYERCDVHFKERNSRRSHMLGTQIPFIQGFGAPTFTYGIEIWGVDLENSCWKVFEKAMKMHMISHVKVLSLTT